MPGERSKSGGDAMSNPLYQVVYDRQASGLDLSRSHAAEMDEAEPLDHGWSVEDDYSTANVPLSRMLTSNHGGGSLAGRDDDAGRAMRVSSHALL